MNDWDFARTMYVEKRRWDEKMGKAPRREAETATRWNVKMPGEETTRD